jgi:two-component system CheB/CheR fusion protein
MAARKRRTSKRRSVKLEELKLQLAEAVETLEAIRSGAVDALVVQGQHGEQVFTLKGADQVYRVLVEDMNEGAVSVSREGCILYCNTRFAELVSMPLEKVVGIGVLSFVALRERANVTAFLRQSLERRGTCETILVRHRNERTDA